MIKVCERMEPYVDGRDLFVEWCANIQSAIPIEFGVIGCPGLSDIDIGIVFKETFDPGVHNLRLNLLGFPEKIRKLMNGGTLMFFPEAVFKDILLIDDIQVQSLSGKIDIRQNTDMEKYLVDLVQIIEWLPERMANIYLELKKTNVNNKRLVGLLYSLCYSLNKIQKYTEPSKRVNDFVEQIYDLRKEWFSFETNSVEARLKGIARLYDGVCVEAVNSITPILSKHLNVHRLDKLQYNICKNINFIATRDEDIDIHEYDGNVYINVPAVFLCTYLEYSKYNSYLGSIIARRIEDKNVDTVISEEMSDILKRRAHIFSSLFDFVKALNCGTGLYKFGWYLGE